jgi:four helix bundle protein
MVTLRLGEAPVGEQGDAIRDFKDLRAWQAAYALAQDVYRLTMAFPEGERYGLVSQMRRASVSAMSNIAEGYGRGALADPIRFVRMARGSLCELEAQLLLSQALGFCQPQQMTGVTDGLASAQRLLAGLHRALQARLRRESAARPAG